MRAAPRDAYISAPSKFKRSKKLDSLIKKDRRAWVVVEGTFYGPDVAEIDPKLPQCMQERLKGTMTARDCIAAPANHPK